MSACQIKSYVHTFTPEEARRILEGQNGRNYRRLDEDAARALSLVMARAEFQLNGEAVKFGTGGRGSGPLMDGQTRLRGCVLSERPFTTLVVEGIDSDESLDTGRARGIALVLSKRGYSRCKVLAGALGWLIRHARGRLPTNATGYIPHAEYLKTLKDSPDIEDFISLATCNLIQRTSMLAALGYLFAKAAPAKDAVSRLKCRKAAERFLVDLVGGVGLEESSPVRRLRERLIRDRQAKAKLLPPEAAALTILAWNYYVAGRLVRTLRWVGTGPTPMPFPRIGDNPQEEEGDESPAA